ncbi:MAG: Mur ligase family protein [Anaerovoracaceae bacterium]|jgi:UDP-N-acetylmuramyl-tripeptide synthetase
MKKIVLGDYVDSLEKRGLVESCFIRRGDGEVPVEYLSHDSKDMKELGLFVCKGAHFKPEYLDEAIGKGAFCYMSEKEYPVRKDSFSHIIVNDIRKAMAIVANMYYGEAWRELDLIGITGTKGKSTVTYYVKSILDEYLESLDRGESAVLSGIDNYDGVIREESHLTTPEAIVLHRHFRNAVNSNIPFLEMEVSSQALRYDRTLGVEFAVGCYLNISEDHISPIEHVDFDDYFDAKLILFKQCRTACINLEADHYQEVVDTARDNFCRIITYGLREEADVYGYRVVKKGDYTSFMVRTDTFEGEFQLGMTGLFNVENALAAISICYALDIPRKFMISGLKKALVPGRMELFKGEMGSPLIIVDYAHNRLSFDKLFTSTIREYPDKKIIAVYGCPGKKALARRKELAEIAGRYSKKIYITEEDPGEEPVMDICQEIALHVKAQNCPYEIEVDRGEAIRKAIEEGDGDTVILITGKGRETRQKRGTDYIDCPSDVEYVERYLKSDK